MPGRGEELAIIMSGGGARAAYQVGFLRCLAHHYPDLPVAILTGVSAGAINAVYLAAHQGSFLDKVETLAEVWAKLTTDQIFRVDIPSVAGNVTRWGMRLMMGKAWRAIHGARSLLDPAPLCALLERILKPNDGHLPGIMHNLDRDALRAVAVTASSYSTGQSVTWVQGRGITQWERAHRRSIPAGLGLYHILASAAIPMFFPAVRIDKHWYGDGGILLTSPLSPAVQLGADRILAISTRSNRNSEGVALPAEEGEDYLPPAQVIGALVDALFLDVFDNDALRLERINALVDCLPEDKRNGLRHIDLLVQRPSQDLGKLANEYAAELPNAFRFMTRGLGTQETRSNDLLSLLMFQPDYLQRMLDLGYADAKAREDEIAAFLAK